MKAILTLAISLVIGAVICLVLIKTGILEVRGPAGAPATETPKATVSDSTPAPSLASSASPPQKAHLKEQPEEQGPKDKDIYQKVLSFLADASLKGSPQVEQRLHGFLTGELGLDDEKAQKIMRMCFWKGFVTLQEEWRHGDEDKAMKAFAIEKELKKAGFSAMGLVLMEREIAEAEARIRHDK